MTTTARKSTAKQIKAATAERTVKLQAMAKNLDMRLLKENTTRCAFVKDDTVTTRHGVRTEAVEIYVYDLDARYTLGRSWTPGRCIATLHRNDSDNATFEALGCAMVVQD